ncbi:MAG TPA: hypothetical protein VML54_06880 [Candidatus Limnocylindrales bacterium]|nr:hypothetical protein [Candidatus Limnocylindrales bacterium]
MTPPAPLLTLEPLVEAVREGVEGVDRWALSGLQKTTSHEFEGRWAGDSTRSAYLFFHRAGEKRASLDVFLDETSRGLRGNLALVLDLADAASLPDTDEMLRALAALAAAHLPSGYRTPVVLRYRLADAAHELSPAPEAEARIKLAIPGAAFDAGAAAVTTLASISVKAFGALLADPDAATLLTN